MRKNFNFLMLILSFFFIVSVFLFFDFIPGPSLPNSSNMITIGSYLCLFLLGVFFFFLSFFLNFSKFKNFILLFIHCCVPFLCVFLLLFFVNKPSSFFYFILFLFLFFSCFPELVFFSLQFLVVFFFFKFR